MPLNPILAELLPQLPQVHGLGLEGARKAQDERARRFASADIPKIGSIESRIVATAARDTPLRIYRPETEGPHPAFFYVHGGGFVYGCAGQWDGFCCRIAKEADCVVVNIDYGRAPEHKFPSAIEECYAVARWAHSHSAELGVDGGRMAVGGDSCGGNISTGLCSLARDRGEFAFIYQVLIYPPLDLSIDPQERVVDGKVDEARVREERWYNECYLGDLERGKDCLATPLRNANLRGMPDALIITGECDPLIADDVVYAKKLIDAGANVHIQCFEGMIHGFINMTGILKEARRAQGLVCSELRRVFGDER